MCEGFGITSVGEQPDSRTYRKGCVVKINSLPLFGLCVSYIRVSNPGGSFAQQRYKRILYFKNFFSKNAPQKSRASTVMSRAKNKSVLLTRLRANLKTSDHLFFSVPNPQNRKQDSATLPRHNPLCYRYNRLFAAFRRVGPSFVCVVERPESNRPSG